MKKIISTTVIALTISISLINSLSIKNIYAHENYETITNNDSEDFYARLNLKEAIRNRFVDQQHDVGTPFIHQEDDDMCYLFFHAMSFDGLQNLINRAEFLFNNTNASHRLLMTIEWMHNITPQELSNIYFSDVLDDRESIEFFQRLGVELR